MPIKADNPNFTGFRQPKQSWSKLPHQFVELLPQFDALTELKVTIYILRHTWGYREYGKKKRLTIEDFVNGRKYKNGKRIDNGTGLSEQGVRDGLKRAIAHGFINCEIDDSDKARVKKYYGLNLAKAQSLVSGVQSLDPQTFDPQPQSLDPNPQNSVPRTKKETKERNSKKDNAVPSHDPSKDALELRAITDLIKAYADVNKVAGNPYNKTGYRSSAKGLYDKGVTADELHAFLTEQKRGWAKNRTVTWTNIENNILTWKDNKKPRAVAPTPALIIDDDLPQPTEINLPESVQW